MGKVFFVTGTDTEVGKTLITASLIRAMRKRGMEAGGYKPLQSGVDEWSASDAGILTRISGLEGQEVLTYSFLEAIAPAFAINKHEAFIDKMEIINEIDKLRGKFDILFVEGAGGWLVPYFPGQLVADWASELKAPVIVIGRAALGTINHTLLTVEAIQNRQLEVAAIILSGATPSNQELAEMNKQYIKEHLSNIPVFLVPWVEGEDQWEKIQSLSEQPEIQLAIQYLCC
ncbi:dethiobiotin synthase [Carboxydocella sp. ULO1]|uniref:dethiobiotin synthase n=1 Tax=Carboxydocella sp. ULO1 TaxID=1926599 RepID=UPI0009ABC939|nr:dethiobiotin synthase [Carboxydocella sp. ULO1]